MLDFLCAAREALLSLVLVQPKPGDEFLPLETLLFAHAGAFAERISGCESFLKFRILLGELPLDLSEVGREHLGLAGGDVGSRLQSLDASIELSPDGLDLGILRGELLDRFVLVQSQLGG